MLDVDAVKTAIRDVLAEKKVCTRLEAIEILLRGCPDDRDDNGLVGDVRELKQVSKNRKAIWALVGTNAGMILSAIVWLVKHA